MDEHKVIQPLPVKHISQGLDEAKHIIDEERSGKQLGLYSNWRRVNVSIGKYFRFGRVTYLAGMSGCGKSTFLNKLHDDFTNPQINGNFHGHVIVLAFSYEMSAADEILRNIATKMEVQYSNLISSAWDNDFKTYKTLSDDDYNTAIKTMEQLKDRPIFYVETTGNLEQLLATRDMMGKKYPKSKFVVTLDHTLLSTKLSEASDLELQANTAKVAHKLKRRYNDHVILIGQLNGEIEKTQRRETFALHTPIKTDIHNGNQIFWACDDVYIIHRPELLHIKLYGTAKMPTKDLIHLIKIKGRFSDIGSIFMKGNWEKNTITEII